MEINWTMLTDDIFPVALGHRSLWNLLQKHSMEEADLPEVVGEMLIVAQQEKNKDMVEGALILGSMVGFPPDIESTYCELLVADWHVRHEEIAFSLQLLKNPSTADCLFAAATIKFDYLAYDDSNQLARKCIKALAAINTERSIDFLKTLATNDDENVKYFAAKELSMK